MKWHEIKFSSGKYFISPLCCTIVLHKHCTFEWEEDVVRGGVDDTKKTRHHMMTSHPGSPLCNDTTGALMDRSVTVTQPQCTEECECAWSVYTSVYVIHACIDLTSGAHRKKIPQTETHLHLHTSGRGRYSVLLCPAIHRWQIFYLAAAASGSFLWIMQLRAPVTSSRPTLHLVCGLKYR